ncbi:SirB2 family protein [Terasakiella sp.]|uniref:SirB2 family protein n=1 Tax=Terasakiella sp. TaxID=2034861 RepID=UPI003AA8C65E
METYWLKIHLAFLALSLFLFFGRSVLSFTRPSLTNHKIILLLTLVSMVMVVVSAVFLAQATTLPGNWITEKVIGLILYIGLGLIALKPTTSPLPRVIFCSLSIAAFLATFIIAKSHTPFIL